METGCDTPTVVKLGYKSLTNTSQGTRLDVPPEDFIEDELFQFDAKRKDGKAAAPTLQGDLHPVFARNNWPDISNKRYNALRQSMLLSTKLLAVSGAYMASFMPDFRQHRTRKMRAAAVPFDDLNPTREALVVMERAQQSLRLSASSLKWREDPAMATARGWVGLTAPHNCRPPVTEAYDRWAWDEADEEEGLYDGAGLRSVCILLMSEYADGILANKPGTAEHLVATFNCGLTMTHELGHYFACSRGGFNPAMGEPFVGEAIAMELGLGFVAWLFGGWHPESIAHTTYKGPPDFSQGNIWMPWYQRGATKQNRGTAYSMRIDHMEKVMNESSWEGQPLDSKPGQVRKKLLHPPSFGPGKCARIARDIVRIGGGYGWDEGAWAEIGKINRLNLRMLPHDYVDLHWDEKPEDTLKPLTGPEKANYKAAWELDLFPRIANADDYEMIYKTVCELNDQRPLLNERDPDDPDEDVFGIYGDQPAASYSQVEGSALPGPELRQLITNINAARTALKGGVAKIGKYILPVSEPDYDPKAAQEAARATADDDGTQAEFEEFYRALRASNATAKTASEKFFGTGSKRPRTAGAPGPGPGPGRGSGSGRRGGNGPSKRRRTQTTIDLTDDDNQEVINLASSMSKSKSSSGSKRNRKRKNVKVEDVIDLTSSRSKSNSSSKSRTDPKGKGKVVNLKPKVEP